MTHENIDIVLDALTCMRRVFRAAPADINGKAKFHAHHDDIKTILMNAVDHKNIRVTNAGLRVMGSFINTLSDLNGKVLP